MPPSHLLLSLALFATPAEPAAGSLPPAPAARAAIREAARLLGTVAAGEPDVIAVQRAAEARAAPPQEDADAWRKRSRIAGVLPKLVAEYRHDERSLRASGISSGAEMDYLRLMPGDTVLVRLGWDLDQLLFGRSELAAAAAAQSAATRRREASERATRLYFERMRLRLALSTSPPTGAEARATAEIELATVTAQLHALTGLYTEELR